MHQDTRRALEIVQCLQSEGDIRRRRVLDWSASADPDVQGLMYNSLGVLWARIQPAPTRLDYGKLVGRVLQVSLKKKGQTPYALTNYGAAREFMQWAALHLANLYRAGSTGERRCLVDGAIEHFFEVDDIRAYFSGWQHDRLLSRAYGEAAHWAEGADAHGNAVSKQFLDR
jgi:hypothetical protein